MEYNPGAVMKLYEDDNKSYCIMSAVNLDGDKYLMLQPLDENGEIKKLELEKVFVIKLEKDESGFEYVKDMEYVKRIITQTLEDGLSC